MPRNQKVDLRRTRKSGILLRGDSPNTSIPRTSRHVRRSSRSKSSATPSGSRNSSNAGADRLTRSRTHSARRATVSPKTRVASDREESESEVEESPSKKVKLGRNRRTPAKAKSSTLRKGNRGRSLNVKVNRRKSKQDSEEDEPEENESDSEYVQKATPKPHASRRRSSRSAIRSSGSSSSVTPSNKGLPAVILKRVEQEMNESPKSARSLRGRSSKQRSRAQRKEVTEEPQADETSSGAAVEDRPVASSSPTSTPSRASRPRSVSAAAARQSRGERRSRTPTKQQPQRKQPARRQQKRSPAKATPSPPQQLQREKRGRASSARQQRQPARQQQRIKMVPSEENAAATTTESLKKEEQEGEEEEEDETTEAVATKKDGSQATEEEEGETQEQQQQAPPSSSERGDDDEDDVKDKQQEDDKKVAATTKDTEAVAATEEKVEEKENPAEEEDVVSSELDGDKRDSGGDVKTKTDEEECGDKEEKMDVDEPIVNSPEEVTSVTKTSKEEESERLSVGGHSTTEAEEPPRKKSRTDDGETHEDAKLDAGIETTKVEDSPAGEDEIKSNDTSDKSSFQDQEMKDDTVGAVNGEESGGVEHKSTVVVSSTLTSVNGSAAEEKESTVNDVDDGSEEKDGGSNGYDTENNVIFASLGKTVPRRCVVNSKLSDINTKDVFTVASFNLSDDDWSDKHENLVNEVLQLSPSILCLQEIDEVYFKNSLDSALKSHGYMGLYRAGKAATKGLAMFYLLSSFEILHHRETEVYELLEKDILSLNLADDEKEAVKSFLHSPAPVLITKLKFTSNGKAVTVGTVHLPGDDEDVLAVQAAAVLREILAISGGANDPHVLCGSFNLREDSIVSKVLSEGHLTSDILNELKAKANVPVPDKEQISLAVLLEKGFQHQSTSLRSSYESVLGHELKFPDKSVKLCRDSVWFSSESLLTKSILDVGTVSGETSPNAHISLKAELAFVN